MSCPVLLVPRRAGIGDRDRLWAWLRTEWWPHLGWPIYEGHHDADEGLFSRSCAVNRAAAQAGDWDVGVVIDGDTIVDPGQVRSAVILAQASGQVTWAFDRFAALSPAMTERVLAGYDGDWEPGITFTFQNSSSSCVAFPRPLWDEMGGFDESFVGWGMEDNAASLAAQSLGQGSHRIAGTAWHLHHEPAEATGDVDHPIYVANRARVQPYYDVGWGDREGMIQLLKANGQYRRFDYDAAAT